MNPVVRGIAVYLFVFLIFRILGKRSMSEVTSFDFVLLLIISETTTDALMGEDFSLISCFIMVCTLVSIDYLFSRLKGSSKLFSVVSDSAPLVIVDKGKPLKKRMEKTKVDEDDVLEAARSLHGIQSLKEVRYAVLERDGSISIIPEKNLQEGGPSD